MAFMKELNLKTTIIIGKQNYDFELFTINKGSVKEIKFDNEIYVLHNGIKPKKTDETNLLKMVREKTEEIKTLETKKEIPTQNKQKQPKIYNTKLIKWINSKGKRPWDIKDFFEKYPQYKTNKNRIYKRIYELITLHKIIQLENKTYANKDLYLEGKINFKKNR